MHGSRFSRLLCFAQLTTTGFPDCLKEQPTGTGSRGVSDGAHGINSDCTAAADAAAAGEGAVWGDVFNTSRAAAGEERLAAAAA